MHTLTGAHTHSLMHAQTHTYIHTHTGTCSHTRTQHHQTSKRGLQNLSTLSKLSVVGLGTLWLPVARRAAWSHFQKMVPGAERARL
jgi:hypothetical protein